MIPIRWRLDNIRTLLDMPKAFGWEGHGCRQGLNQKSQATQDYNESGGNSWMLVIVGVGASTGDCAMS